MSDETVYETSRRISPAELLRFYAKHGHRTTATERQVVRMIDNTHCFVTARRDGELIGFARGTTDGVVGQLAECKLDPRYQGPGCITRTDGRIEHDSEGIAAETARRVIASLREAGVERITVLAYGTEVDFCEEMGFKRMTGVVALQQEPSAVRGTVPAGPGGDTVTGVGTATA